VGLGRTFGRNARTDPVAVSASLLMKRGTVMGLEDKISNAAEEAKGKVREATGKAAGDDNLAAAAEGKGDQASADVKQAAEKVQDTVKRHAGLPRNSVDVVTVEQRPVG
jgi:uncharacterized protein YjbJ (UPF0337 family)